MYDSSNIYIYKDNTEENVFSLENDFERSRNRDSF